MFCGDSVYVCLYVRLPVCINARAKAFVLEFSITSVGHDFSFLYSRQSRTSTYNFLEKVNVTDCKHNSQTEKERFLFCYLNFRQLRFACN